MAKKIKKTNKLLYSKCCKCKQEKNTNRATYCPSCSREAQALWRLNRSMKCDVGVNIEGLTRFIRGIERRTIETVGQKNFDTGKFMLIDFNDISNIVFFFDIISDIGKYDDYKGGEQVKMMWDDLMDYWEKHSDNKRTMYIKKD